MRIENFATNEYYCVSNEGLSGDKIFADDEDKIRFIFLIAHFQSPIQIYNVSWYTKNFLKKSSFNMKKEKTDHMLKKRAVELLAFVITSNNFHLLLRNLEDGILSVYMHRVLTAYSKYFNAKYHRRGHVFYGPFKAERARNNDELLRLSAHIHKDPQKVEGWEQKYDEYPHSSFQDYIGLNRWGHLLSTEKILKQFKDKGKYRDFVVNGQLKN